MLTTYVVNRMNAPYYRRLFFQFGTNRFREAITVLKSPMEHRLHILEHGYLGPCDQGHYEKVSSVAYLYTSLYLIQMFLKDQKTFGCCCFGF